MPLSAGIDDAWPSRLPQGWTTLPDGSVGPSSQVPDWLKQLIPSPGAEQPYGPGGAPVSGAGPAGEMPGGGLLGYNAVTPGAPSMGYPAQGGPQIFPPRNSTIPPMKSVGPFTGGTSTESGWDPRTWFKGGQPLDAAAAGGGFNPLSFFARGNPYARAAIAAGGVLSPTPAETGEFTPAEPNFVRPDAPMGGVHGLPPPAKAQPYTPMPWRGPIADAPAGDPSATPRPGGAGRPATVASAPAKSPFIRIDKVNAGPLAQPGRGYQTALDLSSLFRRG